MLLLLFAKLLMGLLLPTSQHTAIADDVSSADFAAFTLAEPFWVTVELLRVDRKEGCLTTAGCSQPRFKVLEDMLPNTERISISWSISEHFVQEASRPFVSYWDNGRPGDVTLSCQVFGIDPTYGFPRVCDQSPSLRIFQDEVVKANDLKTTAVREEELGKRLIEVRAKCFNATITVQKHTQRCPWCPDSSHATIIEQKLPEDAPAFPSSVLSQLRGEEKVLHVSILILAAIAVLASLGFAGVLIVFLRQKKIYRHISVEPRYQPFSPSPCKTSEDESRYDMPWGQTRPFTHWLFSSSKSEATTTSPLDSTSLMVAPYSSDPDILYHRRISTITFPQTPRWDRSMTRDWNPRNLEA